MPRKYRCRNCDFEYHRNKHDKCPNCETVPESNESPEPRKPTPREIVDQEIPGFEATITKKGNDWRVEFQSNQVVNTWINCPACGKKMFQNNIMWGELEGKCNRCNAIVTFVFT